MAEIDPKEYDADSFMEDEIWDFLKRQNQHNGLVLYGTRETTERARKRFLNFGNRNGLILESERLDENRMQIIYRGLLPS